MVTVAMAGIDPRERDREGGDGVVSLTRKLWCDYFVCAFVFSVE